MAVLLSTLCMLVFCLTEIESQGGAGTDGLTNTLDAGIQEIIVPMCSIQSLLPPGYTHTRLPNRQRHNTQVEVYRRTQHLWSFVDYGCSVNFRLMVCSFYLPMYNFTSGQIMPPCRETCRSAKSGCGKTMKSLGSRWPRQFRCNRLLAASSGQCLAPMEEPSELLGYTYCVNNTIPMCRNLRYTMGSLPNMFLQRSVAEITNEISLFIPLVRSRCSPLLPFLLCGTYMPFCVWGENPFAMPCRELCEAVRTACERDYMLLYHGLPWPQKLECHRFRASESMCVMPTDN